MRGRRVGWLLAMLAVIAVMAAAGCASSERSGTESASVESSPVRAEVVSSIPNVQKVTFHSDALDKDMKFNIYFPPGYATTEKYPVLYIYHGYGGNEDSWTRVLGIDKVADEWIAQGKIEPLIIVTPQIDVSYGFNSEQFGNYGDYIVQDVIRYVDGNFSTAADRENRYIGGLSMGGWAALHHAFTHPELFSKAGGHSPAVWMDDWMDTGGLKNWIYPTEEVRKQRDPYYLADTADLSEMSVYLDSGDQDYYKFYQGAEALDAKLRSRNVRSEYRLNPGGHDEAYWTAHLGDYLLFYSGSTGQ
ncbi:esterase [Cohnella sp. CIP 111063]|uniref:alpha/beta hydrolase n=1 Tax=unclassified Cohnella TaxID=2636738 RepID=UPI000B9D459D|nr:MULTISPECIES: alpha/beta hydrolase-fold protein [unclassified Cohnella]OXS52851.1 esterase [Cohnella sp. CIP 111063]PRX59824.1 enterochelin esterase-like enzyme [Cohnella sp. SGD-V74]